METTVETDTHVLCNNLAKPLLRRRSLHVLHVWKANAATEPSTCVALLLAGIARKTQSLFACVWSDHHHI